MTPKIGVSLMYDYVRKIDGLKNGNEPYPTSLRIINWCKFVHKHHIDDPKIIQFIASDLDLLSRSLEYHLMGNHLLENGFALYFGGQMLGLEKFVKIGKKILKAELNEQILSDGAHFERSPMYHLILLERLLDCVNVAKENEKDESFLNFLNDKSQLMINWMNAFCFSDASYAMVNDAAFEIAKPVDVIFDYAKQLGFDTSVKSSLGSSGYRKLTNVTFEVLADVGDIGPDYIPGHAHSDTLSFVMQYEGKPFIVDTGTSTYEANERRQLERSTQSHNTVMLNGVEQTEVWGAFRVARRAKASIIKDEPNHLIATHDGYKRLGLKNVRTFKLYQSKFVILDTLNKNADAKAWIHFHPSISPVQISANSVTVGSVTIEFEGSKSVHFQTYQYAEGFNRLKEAHRIEITFSTSLKTTIYENLVSK